MGVVYVIGNGGSASTASHFVCDLVKIGFRAVSLADNASVITMIGNDMGFESIFSRQLNRSTCGDVLIALSVSGNSPNILKAVKLANYNGVMTVGLTGKTGGNLADLADTCYHAQSDDYREVENEHLAYLHSLLEELDD